MSSADADFTALPFRLMQSFHLLKMSTPCKFYGTTGCKKGTACTFDHAIVDMARTQGSCVAHLLGTCAFGGGCKFTHKTIGDVRAAAAAAAGGASHGSGKRHGGKEHHHHDGLGALSDSMKALALVDKRSHGIGPKFGSLAAPTSPAAAAAMMAMAAAAAAHGGAGAASGAGSRVIMRTVHEEIIITSGGSGGGIPVVTSHAPGKGAAASVAARKPKPRQVFEIVLSFDTTGSMYSFLEQVKAAIKSVVSDVYGRLARKSKAKAAAAGHGGAAGAAAAAAGAGKDSAEPRKLVRFAIIAHGDYCDAASSYVIKSKDFSTHSDELKAFVDECGKTSGGDSDECYELALHKAGKLHWSDDAAVKALVLFGDANPHEPDYYLNKHHYNWRTEAATLKAKGVTVYPVHCGGSSGTRPFYDELARITGGHVLSLSYDRTPDVTQLITGICLKAASERKFAEYEEDLRATGARSDAVFRQLASMRIVRSHMEVTVAGSAGGGSGGSGAGAHGSAAGVSSMIAGFMAAAGAGGGGGMGMMGPKGHGMAGALLDAAAKGHHAGGHGHKHELGHAGGPT